MIEGLAHVVAYVLIGARTACTTSMAMHEQVSLFIWNATKNALDHVPW